MFKIHLQNTISQGYLQLLLMFKLMVGNKHGYYNIVYGVLGKFYTLKLGLFIAERTREIMQSFSNETLKLNSDISMLTT